MTLDRADLAVLLVLVGLAVALAAAFLMSPALLLLGAGVLVALVGWRNLH